MYTYKLKILAKRGASFVMAVGLLSAIGASAFPAETFANALNPLTERTLLLSSSSPGNHFYDGAGNTTYAPPGSGPNGKQTGETFSFKVSTNSSSSGFGFTNVPIKAFTFQYCTTAAGLCTGPGDGTTNLDAIYSGAVQNTDFEIYVGGVKDTTGDWSLSVSNEENGSGSLTGADNFITLFNDDSTMQPTSGTAIKIVFKASGTDYITNPASGAFFVRLNDYSSADGPGDHMPATDAFVIDGGVTVANVMTDSIQIQTKVLETMSFSVGTTNPDAVPTVGLSTHGPCDAIIVNDPINLGNSAAEYSLEVGSAYDGHSYWRLSSNSSNGASVYYSGYTLSNTVGDQIDAIGTTPAVSHPGQEQFGLALDTTADTLDTSNSTTAPTNHLTPLVADTDYDNGAGAINSTYVAQFAFDTASSTVPALLATENTDVVDCATGKMRYVGNIAASTPAGIYASKINYLAAPQY